MANSSAPQGCGPHVDSLYYNLCDLRAAWGVVLEAFAAAGSVFSVVLLLSLLASLPFMLGKHRRGSVALHAFLLVFTAGLFCLTFAFIVGKDFATCASRRFLFGVLFAGCFSCLLMQSVRVNILTRKLSGPRTWLLCLGALGLWLVEVIINAEWLIITVVRHPQGPLNGTATPCSIANEDFAAALVYVMALLLAAVVSSVAVMAGKHRQGKWEGVCILLAALLSVGIWVAWVVMYVYGNGVHGAPTWDDPTLAVALVANAWVFLVFYSIPELCCLGSEDDPQESYREDLYPSRAVGYETMLKEHSSQNVFMENKAFSMDEPNQGTCLLQGQGQLRVEHTAEFHTVAVPVSEQDTEPSALESVVQGFCFLTPDRWKLSVYLQVPSRVYYLTGCVSRGSVSSLTPCLLCLHGNGSCIHAAVFDMRSHRLSAKITRGVFKLYIGADMRVQTLQPLNLHHFASSPLGPWSCV